MSSLLTSTCCRAYFGDLAEFLQLSMYYLLNCNDICFRNILTNGFSTFSDCQELFFPANLPQFVYFFPSVPHAASHGRWILQRDHFQNWGWLKRILVATSMMQNNRLSGLSVLSIENEEGAENWCLQNNWRFCESKGTRLSCVYQIKTNTEHVLHFVLVYTLWWLYLCSNFL